MNNNKVNNKITVKICDTDMDRLNKMCELQHVSISYVIRTMLENYLSIYEYTNNIKLIEDNEDN